MWGQVVLWNCHTDGSCSYHVDLLYFLDHVCLFRNFICSLMSVIIRSAETSPMIESIIVSWVAAWCRLSTFCSSKLVLMSVGRQSLNSSTRNNYRGFSKFPFISFDPHHRSNRVCFSCANSI